MTTVERCCEVTGRTPAELAKIIETPDNWGALVHSFEYLTMLGVIREEIRREHNV